MGNKELSETALRCLRAILEGKTFHYAYHQPHPALKELMDANLVEVKLTSKEHHLPQSILIRLLGVKPLEKL